MSNIEKKLRDLEPLYSHWNDAVKLMIEASDEIARLSAEVKRLAIEDGYNDQALDKYWKENKRLIAENKRLEALDKNWLRASEQWVAEIERQKHINTTHLEEHQRLVAENTLLKSRIRDALHCLVDHNFDEGEDPRICDLAIAYQNATVSTEQAPVSPKTAIEKDGINDRGSDEYANPERDGDRQ